MKNLRRSASLAILLALVVLAPAAPQLGHARDYGRDNGRDHYRAHRHDRDRHRRDEIRHAVEAGEIKSLAEIFKMVEGKLPGDVAGIEIDRDDGQWLYEFRVINSQGQIYEVEIDARSGEIKQIKEK